jgi:hypothetical protein
VASSRETLYDAHPCPAASRSSSWVQASRRSRAPGSPAGATAGPRRSEGSRRPRPPELTDIQRGARGHTREVPLGHESLGVDGVHSEGHDDRHDQRRGGEPRRSPRDDGDHPTDEERSEDVDGDVTEQSRPREAERLLVQGESTERRDEDDHHEGDHRDRERREGPSIARARPFGERGPRCDDHRRRDPGSGEQLPESASRVRGEQGVPAARARAFGPRRAP